VHCPSTFAGLTTQLLQADPGDMNGHKTASVWVAALPLVALPHRWSLLRAGRCRHGRCCPCAVSDQRLVVIGKDP
jgi:hypothetical protein